MQSLDVFLSRLLPHVMGCPDVTAKQALLDSCIEFCEETLLVQHTSPPQTATANVGTYTLTLPEPTHQAVAMVQKMWFGTSLLSVAASNDVSNILALTSPAGTESAATGTPSVYYEISPGLVGIYPRPETTQASMISARLASKPLRTATQVDDILYTDWVETIVAGAIGRLCETAGQPYSNPSLAASGYAKFWRDVSKATNLAKRGRVVTSMYVTPRAFA